MIDHLTYSGGLDTVSLYLNQCYSQADCCSLEGELYVVVLITVSMLTSYADCSLLNFNRIASILISRFMLNLRQHIDEGNSTGSNSLSFVNENTRSGGSIHFENRLVGNMGAPLDHNISGSLLFDDGDDLNEDYTDCNEEFVSTLAYCALCKK